MFYLFKVIMMCCIATGIIIGEGNGSQELDICGKVMDLSGSPVSDATVEIKAAGKSGVTDEYGNFCFPHRNGIIASSGIDAVQSFAVLRNGKLEIRTSKRTLVSVTGFNFSGKTIYRKKRFVNAGVHGFPVPTVRHGVRLFKVNADGQTAYLKACSLVGTIHGKIQAESGTVHSGKLAQIGTASPFKDTIFVTKPGYLEYALRIMKPKISDLKIRIARSDHPKLTQKHIYKIGSAPFRSCHTASILELPDGTLLSVFFGGSGEGARDVEIRLCRKEPGKAWTAPISVADGMLNGKRASTGNPTLFQSFDGKIILFYGILSNRRYGSMKTSTDGGKTWSKAREICGECIGPEKNKPVQLEDGTILSPSSDRIDNSGLRVEISKDNGETWSTGPGVGGGIQPTIMFHPNGRLQMMARTGGAESISVTWSDDNGQSWSKPSASILPNNNSGLDAVTLRDGRQLLAYNHSYRGQAEMGHKGRGFLTVSVSKDGKAWEAALIVNYTTYRKNLFQFSYPAVIQSRNGLVHLVHTWGRVTINHAVINPASLKTVPMPDGKWPSKGHLSIEEWKKENPKYNQPETKM